MTRASRLIGYCVLAAWTTSACAQAPEAADTEPVLETIYEDSSRSMKMDANSIKKFGSNVSVLFVTIFDPPVTEHPGWAGRVGEVTYWYEQLIFRCGREKFTSEHGRMTDKNHKVLRDYATSRLDSEPLVFFDIAINVNRDMREIQYDAACAK